METHPTNTELAQGVRRLRDLLPWAKAEIRKTKDDLELTLGALAKAQMRHVTEDNFEALVIYPAPMGGWHADLFFKLVPPGVPNCLGSPVANPLATKQEAEESAKRTLIVALKMEAMAAADPKPTGPAFLFYDQVLPLVESALAAGAWVLMGEVEKSEFRQNAIKKLDSLTIEHFPNGVRYGQRGAVADEHDKALFVAAHAAALAGIFAYPLREDAAPPTHETHQTTQ